MTIDDKLAHISHSYAIQISPLCHWLILLLAHELKKTPGPPRQAKLCMHICTHVHTHTVPGDSRRLRSRWGDPKVAYCLNFYYKSRLGINRFMVYVFWMEI